MGQLVLGFTQPSAGTCGAADHVNEAASSLLSRIVFLHDFLTYASSSSLRIVVFLSMNMAADSDDNDVVELYFPISEWLRSRNEASQAKPAARKT
jgi:hypothetical protein